MYILLSICFSVDITVGLVFVFLLFSKFANKLFLFIEFFLCIYMVQDDCKIPNTMNKSFL